MRFFVLALGLWAGAPVSAHAEFSGRIRGEEQYFIEKQYGSAQNSETSAQVELEEKLAFSETWKFRLEPRVRVTSLPRAVDVPIDGDFRDSLVEKNLGFVRVQAGSFIKAWEGTDGLNPMDIATARTYRDPLNSEAIGSVGVALAGTLGEAVSWDALYVPWQTPTRLPGNSAAWWPQRIHLPIVQGNTQLLLSDSPQYDIAHHDTLNRALNDNYGARVQLHQEAWDFSVAYFEGAAQIPVFEPLIRGDFIEVSPKVVIKMSNPISVIPIEYRRRTVSAAAVRSEQSWIFRIAGRYDQPLGDSPLLPSWSDQVVGSVEKTLSIRNQTVILVTQFAYEDRAKLNGSVLDSIDPFERAVLLGMRLPYSDDLLFYVSGLIDVHKGSSVARFNAQRKLGEHWLTELTGEWIQGGEDTLLGVWKSESRAFVSATYRF